MSKIKPGGSKNNLLLARTFPPLIFGPRKLSAIVFPSCNFDMLIRIFMMKGRDINPLLRGVSRSDGVCLIW